MKTLKEYAEFLYKNEYKENLAPFTFLDGHLEIVEFIKNDYLIRLYTEETGEFSDYLESLQPGTEYQVEYENYIVKSAFIESPICNVSDFLDGSTDGITLVLEPGSHVKHSLDLFELCIGFQKTNLLEHELFIMSERQKHLAWAKDNLVPVLERHNYFIEYDSFFDTKNERCSSNIRIDFKHPNQSEFILETDCLTGNPIIWSDIYGGTIDLTDKIYGKDQDEVYQVLLENVWKKDDLKFGYIYNNDPHETIDTYREVLCLMASLEHRDRDSNINFDIIPSRYDRLVEEYKRINPNER